MPKFELAPEVEKLANTLIPRFHEHLCQNQVRVVYLFSEQPEKVRGKDALGTAGKVSGKNAYLYLSALELDDITEEAFFVMTIWKYGWKNELTEDQRVALVDHELCHFYSVEDEKEKGKIKLALLPHDVEEFNCIVKRHGRWYPDIQAFVNAANGQPALKLFGETLNQDSGIDSLTISHGDKSVTLNRQDFADMAS